MRNKIDNLVVANLVWLLVILSNFWIHSRSVLYVSLVGSLLTVVYSAVLFKKTPQRVEKSARPRLKRRIVLCAIQSLVIAAISFSFFH